MSYTRTCTRRICDVYTYMRVYVHPSLKCTAPGCAAVYRETPLPPAPCSVAVHRTLHCPPPPGLGWRRLMRNMPKTDHKRSIMTHG